MINNEESRMPNFIQTNSATASRTPYLSKMSGEPRTLLSKKAKMKALSAPKRDETQLINRTRKEEINRNVLPVSSNEREDEVRIIDVYINIGCLFCSTKRISVMPIPIRNIVRQSYDQVCRTPIRLSRRHR